MNIVNKLTLRHLRLNRGRTLMTIMGIVLSVAMVCCVAGFVMSMRDLLLREIRERKGDWHVVYVDITKETAAQIAGEDILASFYTGDGDTEGLTNIYLRLDHPDRDILEVAGGIAEKYGVETWGGNTELLALEGVFPHDNVMTTFVTIAVIAIVIIMTGSVIVIANAFYISSSERVRQFGLLKSAGATGGQLGRSILFEAAVLAAVAIPIGILLGFAIQAVVLWLTNDLLGEVSALNRNAIAFRVVFDPLVVWLSVGIAVLTVLVSAWLPARRAARTSPIDAIRQTKDIKIRARKLKTSRLTRALFGFEGTLAAKSLKRSRGKYRATVVSLTVSIILFVSMSSFIWTLNKGVGMEYGGHDLDVLVYTTGDLATLDEVDGLIRSLPDAQVFMSRGTALGTVPPDGFYTKRAEDNGLAMPYPMLMLQPTPDADFAKIVPSGGDGMRGILVNTTGTLHIDNKIVEFSPYVCAPGTVLNFGVDLLGDDPQIMGSVTVSAVVKEIPDFIPAALFQGDYINVFIPETAYRAFFLSREADMKGWTSTQYAITADDPDAFCEKAWELLSEYRDLEDGYVSINNFAQTTRLNRNITLIFMIFGYGFIAMLSLIAVTSVIATISTGMALRRQEFAMLYSAGMTPGGMNKMLSLESLLYGLKSLIIGLPMGVALSYLIYLAMGNVAEFAYQPPWSAMFISAAAVMLLTFGTMRYGKAKLNKISIVEAIRSEAV